MRPLQEVSGLCICLILSRLFNAVTSIVYVENGTSLILKPTIQGEPEDILWTHNGNKVAERDQIEFLDYGQFKERSEIDFSTGQLKVHHITSHDSGIYRSVIQINGKLQNSVNEVQVIDAVPEPVVTCHLNSTSRALFCSVSSRSRVSYEWTGSSSAQRFGREFQLSGEEKPDSVYTCTVRNEVSRKSRSFSLKHCDTDEPQSYQNIILPVAVIAAILVIIAVAVGIYLFIRRKKKGQDQSLEMNNDQRRSSGNQVPNGNQAPRNRDDEEGNDSGQSVDNNEYDGMNVEEYTNDPEQRRKDSEDGQENGQEETDKNKGETDPLV